MVHKSSLFAIVILAGVAIYFSPFEQRQAIAKYIFFCLIAAIVLRPIGLSIGRVFRKLMRKE